MMHIILVAVGTIKASFYASGIAEYCQRLNQFAKVEIVEVKEQRITDETSPKAIATALHEEARLIRERIPEGAYTIALAIEGKQLSSEEFATMITEIGIYRSTKVVFLIGGSHGLEAELKTAADARLSFSRATFPHQMMRLIFLEQLYRAFMIAGGRNYHK